MSRDPYPAKSRGSTPAWQNQVTHSDDYGPSGELELLVHVITLLILTVTLLVSLFDRAENTTITNSQIITQIQFRSTGV